MFSYIIVHQRDLSEVKQKDIILYFATVSKKFLVFEIRLQPEA